MVCGEQVSVKETIVVISYAILYFSVMNNDHVTVYTIGFTGASAENFFTRLQQAEITKIIDTRLWASSQLAGFAKKKDLPFFLREIGSIEYEYRQELAPSDVILKAYKNNQMSWPEYEQEYVELIKHRNVDKLLSPEDIDKACFLCACKTHHQCHNRLLAEYLQTTWKEPVQIIHL